MKSYCDVLKAPFPWFGGKSRVSPLIWERFGNIANYVEPFFGSGAVLLGRPSNPGIETVNDKDGFVSNFWRSLQREPELVAFHADWPVNENDLHARHVWLKSQRERLQSRLEGDPEYFDPKIAGWWVWGLSCWIGGGFCGDSGIGPWNVVDGKLVHLSGAGHGVSRSRVHLRGAGHGVSRSRVHLGDAGRGVYDYFKALAQRLRFVRVCSGDWIRVLGPTPTEKNGITGVFLDPPYSNEADRDMNLYTVDNGQVAHAVREWAIANGENPMLRIALCGYDGEHVMPESWDCVSWKAHGGYGTQSDGRGRENAHRERIWFSPHCLGSLQEVFDFSEGTAPAASDRQPSAPQMELTETSQLEIGREEA